MLLITLTENKNKTVSFLFNEILIMNNNTY